MIKEIVMTYTRSLNMSFYKTLLSFVLITIFTTAYAIDKKLHPVVTDMAIGDFNQCLLYLNKHKDKILKAEDSPISAYTKIEDESPAVDRAGNWHFHDQFHGTNNSLKRRFFILKTSLHDVFNERVKALSYVDNDDPFLEIDYDVYLNETREQIAGRIIHYIQDMGVPAHVSPIYHSKPEGWWQEHFFKIPNEPDPFDELFEKDNINSLDDIKINNAKCETLYKKSQERSLSLVNVLDDFAAETRSRVSDEIKNPTPSEWNNKSWEDVFWPIRKDTDAYGNDKYAHKDYGKYGFLKYHENIFSLQSKECDGENNVCLEFFKQQYLSIRDNTVLALMMIYLR